MERTQTPYQLGLSLLPANFRRHHPEKAKAVDYCKRGHLLLGDNLRIDEKARLRGRDGRVCKECAKIRSREYHRRQAKHREARGKQASIPLVKTCRECKQTKAGSEFYINAARGTIENKCRTCVGLLRASNRKKNLLRNKVVTIAGFKECSWCKKTKPRSAFHFNRCERDGFSPYCKECRQSKAYPYASHRRYGITPERYETLYARQHGKCAICAKHESELGRRLQIDHCHETGRVRGLLCFGCNAGLGHYLDNSELLEAAARYLRAQVGQVVPGDELNELGNGQGSTVKESDGSNKELGSSKL